MTDKYFSVEEAAQELLKATREKIEFLAKEHDIKELIIAVNALDIADFTEIAKICHDCGLTYRKIKGLLELDKEYIPNAAKN